MGMKNQPDNQNESLFDMKKLQIQGTTGRSILLVGEQLKNLNRYLPTRRPVIITDEVIEHLYGDRFPPGNVITIGTGERIKTLETVNRIYAELVAIEAGRSTCIVGIGGGIVCDITGFVASTYLQGDRFGFVASTLLAQVDASVGGKNGVNFGGYKNMVGTFNQPEFVICDLKMLPTLPDEQLQCGFAEIVKHAAILFRQQRSGRIITFSSQSGLVGNSGQANYGAAKSGIAGFVFSPVLELGFRHSFDHPCVMTVYDLGFVHEAVVIPIDFDTTTCNRFLQHCQPFGIPDIADQDSTPRDRHAWIIVLVVTWQTVSNLENTIQLRLVKGS